MKEVVTPHHADVLNVIKEIGVGSQEGPTTRTILRLLMRGILPVEIASIRPDDFRLPASATLRLAPNLEFTVAVPPQRGWNSHDVRLCGDDAQDARQVWQARSPAADRLFTKEAIQAARKQLTRNMGHPVSVKQYKSMSVRLFFEKLGLPASLIHPSRR